MTQIEVCMKNNSPTRWFDDVEWWSETRKTLEIIQEREYTTLTTIIYKSEIESYTITEMR